MLKKILGWVPAVVFLLGMVISTFDIWMRRLVNWATRVSPRLKRQTETRWQLQWAQFYNHVVHQIMGISMPIRFDVDVPRGKPSIIILNHRTALDHLLAAQVIKVLGIEDVRWVLKREMRRAPVIGTSFHRAGYAFVGRNGDPADKEAIRAMARQAREDGASVAIYPEGTRHHGIPREGSRWTHLRDPKTGGLQVLMDELSHYQIVFVCLDWRGLRGGRTMWDGDGLLGIHGVVQVWCKTLEPGEDAQSVLEQAWTHMDKILEHDPQVQTKKGLSSQA